MSTDFPKRRLYGRQRGHRLSPRQQHLMDNMLPGLKVGAEPGPIADPAAMFATAPREVWLEIGFGAGEHLAALAAAHRDIGFIGCEPYVNGIAKLLVEIEERSLGNIRIHDNDAHFLLPRLADASIARVFVLFPDPWPKKRHHKRRLINTDSLDQIARILVDDGVLRIASDIDDYVYWIMARLDRRLEFSWQASSCADWKNRPGDATATRYETRALKAGRRPHYLSYRRHARQPDAG